MLGMASMNLTSMKHGEQREFSSDPGGTFKVTYHERQSEGDDGRPVRGAVTGGYTVEHPNGQTSYYDHGPHAKTVQAAKRGANPNAKQYAAGKASDAMTAHWTRAKAAGGLFNDRRL